MSWHWFLLGKSKQILTNCLMEKAIQGFVFGQHLKIVIKQFKNLPCQAIR